MPKEILRRSFPRGCHGLALPLAIVFLLGTATALTGCSNESPKTEPVKVGATSSALTAAECNFFDSNGKVRICHATPSSKNPYIILQVSDSGCINGHVAHLNDYVATATDLDCHGGGCFPVGAPADPKIPCCPALVAKNGVCTDLCAGVTCTALDQCHTAGVCDPNSGACSNPNVNDGTACNDGNACTQTDTCRAGACVGANPITCTALDQCHVTGACDPRSGACSNPNANDGTACNDGNACTQTDTCQAGACAGSNPVTCTALDQCHVAGVCDPKSGSCSSPNANEGTACNDGNACTQTDSCRAGACVGSNPVTCTALDQCHVAGVCDPRSGSCSSPNASDGTACIDPAHPGSAAACTAAVCTVIGPPRPTNCRGRAFGDPHLITHDGVLFDAQGTGDFVLSSAPAFTVQARFAAAAPDLSYLSAVATEVGGVRLSFSDEESPPLRVAGVPTVIPPAGLFLTGGGRVDQLGPRDFQISYPTSEALLIQTSSRSTVAPARRPLALITCRGGNPGPFSGPLGNANGNPLDDAAGGPATGTASCGALGSLLEPARVSGGNSFFGALGPSTVGIASRPRSTADLPAGALLQGQTACSAVANPGLHEACVLDVGATGDASWADGYAGIDPPAVTVRATADVTAPSFALPALSVALGAVGANAAKAVDSASHPAPVLYASSDPSVATVDALSGAITPVHDGAFSLIATSCGGSGSAPGFVYGGGTANITIQTGGGSTGGATFLPQEQIALVAVFNIINTNVSDLTGLTAWATSDPTVAAYVSPGRFTAVGPGTCTITARLPGGLFGTLQLTVVRPIEGTPGTLLGGNTTAVTDVNDSGVAVGFGNHVEAGVSTRRAFRWDNSGITELPLLPGMVDCRANAINSKGQIVGTCGPPNYDIFPGPTTVGVLWDNGTVSAIARTASAEDINAAGQVTGGWWHTFSLSPYVNTPGANVPFRDIGWFDYYAQPQGSSGYGINAGGDVVGATNTAVQFPCYPRFCFGDILQAFSTTGPLTTSGVAPPNNRSGARAVNLQRVILGSVATYSPAGAELTLWRPPASGTTWPSEAVIVNNAHIYATPGDINDAELITATGYFGANYSPRAFLCRTRGPVVFLDPLPGGAYATGVALNNVDTRTGLVTVVGNSVVNGLSQATRWVVRPPP